MTYWLILGGLGLNFSVLIRPVPTPQTYGALRLVDDCNGARRITALAPAQIEVTKPWQQ